MVHFPCVLLVDANARVGDTTCSHIGDFANESGCEKSEPFTSFLRAQDIWLPCTFDCHQGPSGTWRHHAGHWTRNDYVGLPASWQVQQCTSWTATDIDLTLQHEDHRVALVKFSMPICQKFHDRTPPPFKRSAVTADLKELRWSPIATPGMDVHSHALWIQSQIVDRLPAHPRHGPVQQKKHLSDSTWQLILRKREWRTALFELTKLQRTTMLQACFAGWRSTHTSMSHLEADWHPYARLLSDQDRLIAQALAQFRQFGRLVVSATRADDIDFFHSVFREGCDFLQPHQSRDLWRIIKKALPKHQQRRRTVDPLRLANLEDQWNPHFEALEAGCSVNFPDLLQCIARPSPTSTATLSTPLPHWTDLPTLFELEDVLRNNKHGKATGNDPLSSGLYHNHPAELAEHAFPLMVKMWIWGEEPLQFKGGPLALIPKRLQPTLAKHFRGILLLPTLAKGFHALLRKRIIDILQPIRSPGQLGGFSQQEVLFGSQALRILGRVATAHHLSVGILFVDLSTAFHCLIREMVVGIQDDQRLAQVITMLRQQGHPCDHLRLGKSLPGLLLELDAPPYLIKLLQDVHASTWMSIGTHNVILTHKGTRPGSPIADAIFHFIMFDVSRHISRFLDDHGHSRLIAERLHFDIESIIWSDDLAIPIVTEHCEQLVPALLRLLDHVRALFLDRGFQLNLTKGKTGVVATFSGPSAASQRKLYQLLPQPGVHHQFVDQQDCFVHFMPAYRHLGTLYTSDQKLDAEIAARIGSAASAFAQVSRRLLTNRHLPQELRLQLFKSLILSKLYFSMGSWHTPTGSQFARLRRFVANALRRILRSPISKRESASHVLAAAGVLDPRVQLAIDRLLYAQRLFHHGPAFLQLMVHAEHSQLDQSWLAGLRHDLRWLYGVEATPDEMLCSPDHTALIDYWQQSPTLWKRRLHRAGKRHIFQETMMLEVQDWHAKIYTTLRTHHFTFQPDPAALHLQECHYPCPDCPRTFTTPQGVHVHRRKVHGVFSLEHHLLDSATCPACLRYFWSTQRLQQHLAYIPRAGTPNPCFALLRQRGYSVSYSAETLPSAMRGQSRLDSLTVQGPIYCGPTADQRELIRLRQVRSQLQQEYDNFEVPDDYLSRGDRLGHILTCVTQDWYASFCEHGHDPAAVPALQDIWIDVLCGLPTIFESWVARTFLAWGQHLLPDLIESLLDGDAERYIDEAFGDLAGDLHESRLTARITQLDYRIAALCAPTPDPGPHRPVRLQQRSGKPRSLPLQVVPRLFADQTTWHSDLEQVRWQDLPADPAVPRIEGLTPRPTFLIVHLFSGRRRSTDLHSHLAAWAQQRNVSLTILSLDTAVAPTLGNLDPRGVTWGHLQTLYEQGLVAATISGHPCETFSAARWHQPPDELRHKRWPRPLRTTARFFGLDHRTMKELFQTRLGTVFFLQTA